MTAERDNPRGPTSEQLRRRVLEVEKHPIMQRPEHEYVLYVPDVPRCDYCGALSPHGCPAPSCRFHG